ncbi:MAG: iron-containing redox enzyme family protein [Gammaproteobacteria bacterium]|jgi:thiaminase
MSFYARLVNETGPQRNSLINIPFIQRGIIGNVSRDEYIAFLTQAYYHVKHTIPLLMACGARLSESQQWLQPAIGEYIEEEMGHEKWILNDIERCGGNPDRVRDGQPAQATELMVAYAYDMIQRINPVGFFGMVYVLEGTSVALATRAADAIQQKLNLPQQAFSYLTSHGALDVSHVHFFEQLMDRVEDSDDQAQIIHCAKIFFKLYGDIFRALDSDAANSEVDYAVA